jgi:energy-coupling factor transporter ATP-binding protein EcfA2
MAVIPVLLMRDVTVRYAGADAPAIHDISLSVESGAGVALLGANGAGKTTLLRSAMALIHPASGTVQVLGRDTRGRHPEDLADVAGYAFQNPESQLFERSVRAEIAFGPRQLGWNETRIAEVTAELLEELELVPWADTHPYDLPVPRRRIVALAATLATRPRLLLLDEPTAGLDATGRLIVERAVRTARAAGAAVVAVTHDGDLTMESFDQALLLDRGRIALSGSVVELLGSTDDAPALPAPAELARRLGLQAVSPGREAVAAALAAHCRSRV